MDAIFNENTKHALWCDGSSCATSRRQRWERMIKQEAVKHWSFQDSYKRRDKQDYEEMKIRPTETDYKMPILETSEQ